MYFNTVAAGANVIFSFFDKSINECNVVGTLGSGFGQSGEECLQLSVFGHRENVIEVVVRIKKNFEVILIEKGANCSALCLSIIVSLIRGSWWNWMVEIFVGEVGG